MIGSPSLKNYPKISKNPWIQHLRSLVTWCLQPHSSRHGSVPIRSKSSNCPALQMELACSVKCGTRKRILDSSGRGPGWKHEFHHHTKCKPVSSGSKLTFSQEEISCPCSNCLRDFLIWETHLRFQSKGTFFSLIVPQIWFWPVLGEYLIVKSLAYPPLVSAFLTLQFQRRATQVQLFVFAMSHFIDPLTAKKKKKTKTLKPPRHRSFCWKMESLHPWSMHYLWKGENFGQSILDKSVWCYLEHFGGRHGEQ
jgi:hypothetical protein